MTWQNDQETGVCTLPGFLNYQVTNSDGARTFHQLVTFSNVFKEDSTHQIMAA